MSSLPLNLDVQISVTKLATLGRISLNTLCICIEDTFGGSGDVIRFYSSPAEVLVDFPANDQVLTATDAFFAQSPRPARVALGVIPEGTTAATIGAALQAIQNAALSLGEFVYGWCFVQALSLNVTYSLAISAWIESQEYAVAALITPSTDAYAPNIATDLGSMLQAASRKRSFPIFSTHVDEHPDVSILAYMLSVNYQAQDSTVTAKFKTLPGVSPEDLTTAHWTALKNKGYNVYSLTGYTAKVFREGTTGDTSTPWFMDTVINMDNFVQDLAVNVYNVFLRNKKVPYTLRGQMLLVDACRDTGNQYIYNGTFADRVVTDTTQKDGTSIVRAVEVVPTPINQMSAADRANRVGPPISMVVQESGAIHSITVDVQLVS